MVIEIDKRNKRVVLSLGGNIGNIKQVFKDAINSLEKEIGGLDLLSSLYKTKAWGVENQPDFLNQVVVMNTNLHPKEVLKICLDVEKQKGRDRSEKKKWQERVIDIDVLFYENEIIKTKELVIPHPYIQERNFVLFPLAEIIPDFLHPLLGNTVLELKKKSTDKLQVIKISD